MSQKVQAVAVCPKCNNKFKTEVYRTVWGERKEFRDQIASDKINLVQCPVCNASIHCASSLLYNDTDTRFAIWWEPKHDADIDSAIAFWKDKFGADFYLCNALRIQDWHEFKAKIAQAYGYTTSEDLLKTTPTRKYNKIESPQAQSKDCVPEVPKPKNEEQASDPISTSANSYHAIKSVKKDITLKPESIISSVLKMQFFGRTTAIVFSLVSLVLAIALVVKSVDTGYYPTRNYSVDQQVRLSYEFYYGDNRVVNYEKAYFWILVANANGAELFNIRKDVEQNLSSKQIKSIQETADKWHKAHRNR